MKDYNTVSFTSEECEKGLDKKFISFLLDMNKEKDEYYYDIHITSDGCCTIVEFLDSSYDESFGSFRFVGDDEEVCRWVTLPDRTRQLLTENEDESEVLDEWLKENPTWKKNSFGVWYNEEDCVNIKKQLNM